MENQSPAPQIIRQESAVPLLFLLILLVVGGGFYLVKSGKVAILFRPTETVTVTGFAKKDESNQVAQFSAGVMFTEKDKQVAIDKVNSAMNDLIDKVKTFGVAPEDIKTENLSIYRMEDPQIYNGGESRGERWQANNSISIKLRNAEKATELSTLLSQSGATNVYGPNFMLDEDSKAENDLIQGAIDDAREKAEIMAKAGGRELGKLVTVSEYGTSSPVYPMMARGMGGGGADAASIEPGTSTISKSVTVTFELK